MLAGMDARGSPITRLILAAVALTFAATALVKIGDADLFGHLATGRWILAHGQIPHVDPFSYASLGPWRYTEALAQVLYACVDRLGGIDAIVWFNATLMLGLAWLVAASCATRPAVAAVVIAWVGAASFVAMEPKPQTFSYLCFAALLWLLRGSRLYAVPLLFLAWGYLHRAGTLGLLVVLGAAAVTLVFGERRRAWTLGLVAIASALALALNPGGLFYFRSTFDVASRVSFQTYLAEWQPLTWSGLVHNHALLLPLVAFAAGERARTRQKPDVESVAVLLSLGVVVASGARLVPFAAIACAPPAARGLDAAVARIERGVRPALVQALLATVALGSLIGWALPRVAPAFWGAGVIDSLVPVHLAQVVKSIPARGHVYHSFDFGGYFLYALTPQRKVLIDGRNDTVYDDSFFLRVLRSDTERSVFEGLARTYDFEIAAVRWDLDSPRGLFLARDPAWALITWDDRGAVYARRDAVDSTYLAAHSYRELRVDTAFQRAQSPGSNDAAFLSELARNTREAPHSARAWLVAALAYRARGLERDYRVARQHLVALVNERNLKLPIP